MQDAAPDPLSRREREIMDIVYRLERASVGQVREAMAAPPSYSSVRALMGTLERKGHLAHEARGRTYLYRPVVPPTEARRSALRRVVDSFFGGSSAGAAVTLLEMSSGDLSDVELDALRQLVAAASAEGR